MRHLISIMLLFLVSATYAQSSDKYTHLVDSMIGKGENVKLLGFLRKELKAHPKSEEVYRAMGYVFIKSNMKDSGEKYYNEALKLNPKCSGCYMNIGVIYAQNNEYNKAISYLDKALAIEPTKGTLYFLRAKLQDMKGDPTSALFDFNNAIKYDTANVEYYLARGMFNIRQKYLVLGLADYSKAIDLAPNDYHPLLQRAEAYFDQQQYEKAISDIKAALVIDSTLNDAYSGLAAIHAAQNNHAAAVEDYTKSLAIKQDYLIYYYRAEERYQTEDMDGYCNDLHMCSALLERSPARNALVGEIQGKINDICDSSRPSYYYQRGIAEFNTANYQNALRIYRAGLRKFPNNCMTLCFAGNAMYELKDYEHCLESYAAAIANKSNLEADVRQSARYRNASADTVALYIKGFMASIYLATAEAKFYLGRPEEALADVNKGIDMAPDVSNFPKANYYNVRGSIFLAQGKYDQALDDFNKCLKIDADFNLARINRAIAKVNADQPMKIRQGYAGYQVAGGFSAGVTFPIHASIKKGNDVILSALTDCDIAVEKDPKLAYGFYIRAQLKKMLAYPDFCTDFIKASQLGYPVEPEILTDCKK